MLYETQSIVERNRDWAGILESTTDRIAIGDDSGGRVLLMRAEQAAQAVQLCDVAFVADSASYQNVTDHLHDWLRSGLDLPED